MSQKELSKKNADAMASIVEAIVTNEKGQILLLKRSENNTFFCGQWQLPGGKVEFGEKVRDGIKREIMEETGCKCKDLKIIKVYSFEKAFNGFKGSLFLMVFNCKLDGKLKLSADHTESKFFDLNKIDKSALTPISKKSIFG